MKATLMHFPSVRLPSVRPLTRMVATLGVCAQLAVACTSSSTPAASPNAGAPAPAATSAASTPQPFKPITLPADDGPHQALTEWWYWNGHVAAKASAGYSFHLVVFKRDTKQADGSARSAYVAHVGITDHQQKRFVYDQQVLVPPVTEPTLNRFDLQVGPVRAIGSNGVDKISGTAGDYRIDLALQSLKPPVIHGDAGIVGVSPAESSYYYSRTRMAAAGTVTVGTTSQTVTGDAWMDHQWGDFGLQGAAGWDWYALQLNDGSDVMVSVLRDETGKVIAQYGTWIGANGEATALKADGLKIDATGQWTSPATKTTYPMGWRFAVPGQKLDVTLAPVMPDQEMDTTPTTGKVYWEGAVTVQGARDGKPVTGYGYVELTGYKERTAK